MTTVTTRNRTVPAAPKTCEPCKGTGQTTVTVFAGPAKRRRRIADQEATCLECLGTGIELGEPQ